MTIKGLECNQFSDFFIHKFHTQLKQAIDHSLSISGRYIAFPFRHVRPLLKSYSATCLDDSSCIIPLFSAVNPLKILTNSIQAMGSIVDLTNHRYSFQCVEQISFIIHVTDHSLYSIFLLQEWQARGRRKRERERERLSCFIMHINLA